MYSFSSASQMFEPFPRTIKGGSPPTDPNPRTGELTPPGIMLSARSCKRRDCSTFLVVVVAIDNSRFPKQLRHPVLQAERGISRASQKQAASEITPARD